MPSLNLTNRTLTYTASDQRVLERCNVLLDAISQYDQATRDDAKQAKILIDQLWAHVNRQRNGAAKPQTK